jgi:hypothetical protein
LLSFFWIKVDIILFSGYWTTLDAWAAPNDNPNEAINKSTVIAVVEIDEYIVGKYLRTDKAKAPESRKIVNTLFWYFF